MSKTNIGCYWQPEMSITRDPVSGATIHQMTGYKGHSSHFYFTYPCWYDNGRKIVIFSDREGRTNLFGVDLASGEMTGWRQDGQNGYVWVLTTPGAEGIRYYEYDHSRGQVVVNRLLKDVRDACLVTDFYAAYNNYAGPQQRCWVHLLQALHGLKEEHAQDTSVLTWAGVDCTRRHPGSRRGVWAAGDCAYRRQCD